MKEKIDLFVLYLRNERRYSELTIQAYQRDLKEFEDFLLKSGGLQFDQIGYQDVRLFVAFLTERQLSRLHVSYPV